MNPFPPTGGSGGDRKREREDENRPNSGGGKSTEEIAAEVVARATKRARTIAAERGEEEEEEEYPAVDALRALAENRPVPQRTPGQQRVQDEGLSRAREHARGEDQSRRRLFDDFSAAFDQCREFTFTESAYRHLRHGKKEFDQTTFNFFSAWSPEGWLRDQPRDRFELLPSTENSGVDFTIYFLPSDKPRYSITGNCVGDSVTVFHIGPVQ